MSVIAICGLPGSGKTLFGTYLARRSFSKHNHFKKVKVNNVFSNYPIVLNNSKTNTFSNIINLYDFNYWHKWYYHSSIFLDEIQLYFDSLEFKDFPKTIRNNFQLHRHFGIDDIYIISQHPSRIVKQLRVLVCEFYDITNFIKIPFTPFAFLRYNIYYNADDFGKSVHVKKTDVPYKFSKKFVIFNYKAIYKSYDTCYMYSKVKDTPLIEKHSYNSKVMSIQDIQDTFNF
jgi:hypothetical protein